MQVKVLGEAGYEFAIQGLSLSYNQEDYTRMQEVAERLAGKDEGHNKFLRFIQVYLDITAPRFWWQEFDTYKIGTSSQSESTIHSVMKRRLNWQDFEDDCGYNDDLNTVIEMLNYWIEGGNFGAVKNFLPEGFLQRRVVCLNYATLRNIIKQRKNHRLPQWKTFIGNVMAGLEHPEFVEDCRE